MTWTLIDGALPPGLQLAHTQSREMPIRGTPETVGVYTFTLRIEEAHGDSVEEQITLEVVERPREPLSGDNSSSGCNPAPGGTTPLVLLAAALAAHRRRKR
jgi:MYXO-CTERM domain-containing protein